jgi:biotin transport system substrate-specific component
MSTWISALSQNLAARVMPVSANARRLSAMAALALGTMLGAWIAIPVPGSPVPVTLQTFFVLAGAGLLGGRWSSASQAGYVLLGGLGLPLFAGAVFTGPVLLGATGGYLLGFVCASWIIGACLRGPAVGNSWRVLGALVLGEAVILTCGVSWLSVALHLPWDKALLLGALPFLPGDAFKLAAAAVLVRAAGVRSRRLMA